MEGVAPVVAEQPQGAFPMIRLTYQYFCDICKAEWKAKDSYDLNRYTPVQDDRLPRPQFGYAVKHCDVCPDCATVALDAIKDRIK